MAIENIIIGILFLIAGLWIGSIVLGPHLLWVLIAIVAIILIFRGIAMLRS